MFLGALLSVVGTASYVVATVKGQTKPNRVSWFLFALAPLVGFAAQISEGVGLRALMTFMVGFGPLVIFIASFVNKKSYWKLTRGDYICGAFSLLALALWGITRTGDVAIALSIVADLAAGAPILMKAWRHPQTESPWLFLLGIGNSGITLLTIDVWSFTNSAFAIYICAFCIVITALLFRPGARKPALV